MRAIAISYRYALSFTQQFMFGRVAGASLTFLVLAVAGVCCVYQGIIALPLQ